jgi:hypothetical protein
MRLQRINIPFERILANHRLRAEYDLQNLQNALMVAFAGQDMEIKRH